MAIGTCRLVVTLHINKALACHATQHADVCCSLKIFTLSIKKTTPTTSNNWFFKWRALTKGFWLPKSPVKVSVYSIFRIFILQSNYSKKPSVSSNCFIWNTRSNIINNTMTRSRQSHTCSISINRGAKEPLFLKHKKRICAF